MISQGKQRDKKGVKQGEEIGDTILIKINIIWEQVQTYEYWQNYIWINLE